MDSNGTTYYHYIGTSQNNYLTTIIKTIRLIKTYNKG